MTPDPLDVLGMIRALLDRGWVWSPAEANLLVHPADHDLGVRYDPAADRLTISPKLDAQLELVIPTPASKGRFWR